MKVFTQPQVPESVFNTICLGLDRLLKTQGLEIAPQVNEAVGFLNTTVVSVPDPEPAAEAKAAPVPRAERRRAGAKKKR